MKFHCPDDLSDRLRGYHKYAVVVDHAAELTSEQEEFYKRINTISHEWFTEKGIRHRDDGPAIIYKSGNIEWWMYGNNITHEVTQWMIDAKFPVYTEWSISEKVLFKLKWGGK